MSAPQAAAITACTACAAVGGAAAGGAFSSGTSVDNTEDHQEVDHRHPENAEDTKGTAVSNIPENPNWYPIADEEDTNKTNFSSTGKIGKDYEKYLVGAYGTTNKSNTAWWTKSFEKYTQDKAKQDSPRQFSTEFGGENVTSHFADKETSSGDKALNQVCLKVYEKDTTSLTGTGNEAKLKDDLWTYCSPLGKTPKTIKDAQEESNYTGNSKIGDTKKEKLLATKGDHNDKLWELKNEEFKKLGSELTSLYFKKVQENIKNTSSPSTLKKECEKTYSMTNSSDTESYESEAKVKDEHVVKYCSLEGK